MCLHVCVHVKENAEERRAKTSSYDICPGVNNLKSFSMRSWCFRASQKKTSLQIGVEAQRRHLDA